MSVTHPKAEATYFGRIWLVRIYQQFYFSSFVIHCVARWELDVGKVRNASMDDRVKVIAGPAVAKPETITWISIRLAHRKFIIIGP